MNFKDEYKRDFDNIKPDDAFKKSLVNQLNEKPVVRSYKRVYANVLAAAAALLLVVGVSYFAGISINSNSEAGYNKDSDDDDEDRRNEDRNDFVSNTEEITKATDMVFETESATSIKENEAPSQFAGFAGLPGETTLYESWYGAAVTDEEIYEVFVSLISGDSSKLLYSSETELFINESPLGKEEMEKVIEVILEGTPVDEEFKGNKTFYRAVFEDGTVISFTISDVGYIRINGRNAVFKVEK